MRSIALNNMNQNYYEITNICKDAANGEGDSVVMDIDTYNKREKMLKLREELLAAEEDRLNGIEGYSISEVADMMRAAVTEVSK